MVMKQGREGRARGVGGREGEIRKEVGREGIIIYNNIMSLLQVYPPNGLLM